FVESKEFPCTTPSAPVAASTPQLPDHTNLALKQLLGVGPDMAIVVGVCTNRLGIIQTGINNLVTNRINTDQEPFNYILMPFTDSNGSRVFGPAYGPNQRTDFQPAVSQLSVNTAGPGRGVCPAPSMDAALLGLNKADEGANLFL